MSFASPLWLALLVLLVPMLWYANKRRRSLGHSQVAIHKGLRSTPIVSWLPIICLVVFWSALVIAMARPQVVTYQEKQTVQSRDFVILVDVSGSMSTPLTDPGQQALAGGAPAPVTDPDNSDPTNSDPNNPDGASQQPAPPTRAQAAQAGVKQFLEHRQGDRVALLLFDDQVYYVWPLTLDLPTVERKIFLISQYNGGGTNFDGPDDEQPNVGGIQGAINHFDELGQSKTKILIMVTDGEDSIQPKRFQELSDEMKARGIRIYVIGVGESWTDGSTPDLKRFAEANGGKVMIAGDAKQLSDGFATIDSMEKSTIQIDRIATDHDIYPLFLGLACVFGLFYLISSALVRDDA